jgi:hypothetical protein
VIIRSSLAVVPSQQGSLRPDISWIKKHVSVLEVGRMLGLRIHHRKARCWRPENHANGDAHPSLHFYERGNRVRCFVCDMRGGHSCIDLVMGVLGVELSSAVWWIADRFTVPNIKLGRPLGQRPVEAIPLRVGVNGSHLEVLVRSGMFGQLSPAESRILTVLLELRDSESGLTKLSYGAIMRYSGVGSRANVSAALTHLQRLHAIQISRGARIGLVRECSTYCVTLEDPKFLAACNEIFRAGRVEIAAEREYRKKIRSARKAIALVPKDHSPLSETSSQTSLRSGAPSSQRGRPVYVEPTPKAEARQPTCEGLNLSSPSELMHDLTVPIENHEIDSTPQGLAVPKTPSPDVPQIAETTRPAGTRCGVRETLDFGIGS